MLEDGIVKEGGFHLERGVGVRALSGRRPALPTAMRSLPMPCARPRRPPGSIARSGQQGQVKVLGRAAFAPLYHQDNPLDGLSRADKVDLLKRIDVATRALDPRIKQVTVSLAGVWEHILVAAMDGGLAADIRPLVRFNVSVIVDRTAAGSAAGRAVAGAPGISTSSAKTAPWAMPAKRCARRWSISRRCRRRQVRCRWCLGRAGPACCCTRPSVTV